MRKQSGVTLMELLVAASIIAILAAVAIPSSRGFLGKGKLDAHANDREILQTSVDVWRNTIGRTIGRPYPILQGGEDCLGKLDPIGGIPSAAGCNPYVDIAALATQGFLQNSASIKSADPSKNTTATNTKSGSYGWWVDTGGVVKSHPDFLQGVYP
ncbi:MAG: prepilin-type N-terminal cleavage/methylation domain-containing protein [Chloroflexi bacterium]|nr:prepilin-type N-terminal cleavage/methylation domain-containing protein [Chloroflexota bacterium]